MLNGETGVTVRPNRARHWPAGILGALAVMLTGGEEYVSDLDILRAGAVFGQVP